MDSKLNGRLRNTHLPPVKGLVPVYEAVINSIEAIEERSKNEQTLLSQYYIILKIERVEQLQLNLKPGPRPEGEIKGFSVTDNGVGFNDKNWESFRTLDSLHKEEKGCRGIGRLMWLKAFDNVIVNSNYEKNNEILTRRFSFDISNEVSELEIVTPGSAHISTIVQLQGFNKRYASETNKTLDKIAAGLLEHCLWYFIRAESVPKITVNDGPKSTDLADLFDAYMHTASSREKLEIKEHGFEITHVKIRVARNKPHTLGYCVSGWLVKEENLNGMIPGLYKAITDNDSQFTYMAYLTGEYLDQNVSSERFNFNIPETAEGLFEGYEISYDDIRAAVLPRIAKYLEECLQEVLSEGREKLEDFVSTKAPKYRPLLSHIPPERLAVDPNISEKELDILLHHEAFKVEQSILKEGHELLSESLDYDDYADRLYNYITKAADLKQSDLANYVAHRRIVIDLLDSAIKQRENGKFAREDVIHELIVPMHATSTDAKYQRQNLWLVDERLAFHHYLASDLPLSSYPTTNSESTKKPDIATIRVFENPILVGEGALKHASITVVEIKRPMREGYQAGEDESKDPILQSLGYLRRLREGACTVDGRPIPNAEKIPGFVYVLADLTNSMKDCCKFHQLQMTADGMGYFGYHRDESYNAYIRVISFDGLVMSANERNRAFFDKLGMASK